MVTVRFGLCFPNCIKSTAMEKNSGNNYKMIMNIVALKRK